MQRNARGRGHAPVEAQPAVYAPTPEIVEVTLVWAKNEDEDVPSLISAADSESIALHPEIWAAAVAEFHEYAHVEYVRIHMNRDSIHSLFEKEAHA